MKENIKPKLSSQQMVDQITKHIEELAQETDAARVSEEMLRYLDMCSKFHNYSWRNTWLIMMTFPNATQVASFHAWFKLKRFVRKGEKGIPILAPIVLKEKSEEKEGKTFLRGFKVVYVFDVSQTEGEPLPALPSWKSHEKDIELQESLIVFAQERGITVTEKALAREIEGVSRGGSIDIAPSAGTSILIHEIAHELLHKREEKLTMTREEKELEAESVAYVVGKHFGLEVANSANYIALWNGGKDAILAHLERISKASAEIVEAIEHT